MKNTLIALFFFLFTCFHFSQTKIVWDTWGVPHIYSNNTSDLFYAQGWAQMHNHANHILKLYGTSRGRGSEYFGEDKVMDDILIHTLGFESLAKEWENNMDPEIKGYMDAFVNGMNAYAAAHPEKIDSPNKVILPIIQKDVIMHSMYVVFTRFIGGGDLGRIERWPDMGSNTYAIGPSKSASGNSMLVQNPHLPWFGEFLFFEQHFILNGKNMYGANLVGLPGIAIGFNDNLGWSHTDNTIDNADTFELELKDEGYLIDGVMHDFEVSEKTIKIKQDNGTFTEQSFPIRQSKFGPIVKESDGKALALKMVGLKSYNMSLQWWRMLNANNFEEFETALKMAQIPFWNVMYADKEGNIFYLFNGLVPKRSSGDWSYWNKIIKGGKSSDLWTEVHPYSDLPKLKNPENGWLQNANDPPWTSTIPSKLNPKDYPSYMAPVYMSFRPQRSAKMLLEDNSITFEELIDYKLSTRLEFADRIIDDLSKATENSESEKAKEAIIVLNKWDKQADIDSKGTLLFYNWARKFNAWDQRNYSKKWTFNNPLSSPDGLSDPHKAVKLLEEAAKEIESTFGTLSYNWGDYYRIKYNNIDLPANGLDSSMGVFRVAWPEGGNDMHMYVGGGDSWVGIIEFGDRPKAKVLLSYGNSTQSDSKHFGDQLHLFSKKELRDAWITTEEINTNSESVMLLQDGKFVVKN